MKIVISEEQFRRILGTTGRDKVLTGNPSICTAFSNSELNEGLIRTFDEKTVLTHLCKYLNFTDDYGYFVHNPDKVNGFAVMVELENSEIGFDIIFPDSEQADKKVAETMSLCGYFKSASDEFCKGYVRNRYEKKFQDRIKSKIVENNGIVHITKKKRLEKILKNGLVPRQEKKLSYHPDRVYFALGPISNNLLLGLKAMLIPYNKLDKFVALRIKPEITEVVDFYYDPNMNNALWTYDNIPPEYIEVIGEI